MNNKLIISVSNYKSIKQYTAPASIKKILFFTVATWLLVTLALAYYVVTLSKKVSALENASHGSITYIKKQASCPLISLDYLLLYPATRQ